MAPVSRLCLLIPNSTSCSPAALYRCKSHSCCNRLPQRRASQCTLLSCSCTLVAGVYRYSVNTAHLSCTPPDWQQAMRLRDPISSPTVPSRGFTLAVSNPAAERTRLHRSRHAEYVTCRWFFEQNNLGIIPGMTPIHRSWLGKHLEIRPSLQRESCSTLANT